MAQVFSGKGYHDTVDLIKEDGSCRENNGISTNPMASLSKSVVVDGID